MIDRLRVVTSEAVEARSVGVPEGQFLATMRLVAWMEARVRGLVQTRRAADPNPDDPYRGLYITDEMVDSLLAGGHPPSGPAPDPASVTAVDPGPRLGPLIGRLGLDDVDVRLLVAAALPDLDARFESLYGYLNDDVTRRRASIGLALELTGCSPLQVAARARLGVDAPLVRHGLVLVDDADRPFLTRLLRVPDRVTAFLLDHRGVDAALVDVVTHPPALRAPQAVDLARVMSAGVALVHVQDGGRNTGLSLGAAALAGATGVAPVGIDLTLVARHADPAGLAQLAVREALLEGCGLVAGPVEAVAQAAPEVLRRLCRAPLAMVLVGSSSWDPGWGEEPALAVEAPALSVADRRALWNAHLPAGCADVDIDDVAGHLQLGPAQVSLAVRGARMSADLAGSAAIRAEDLRNGIRAQNASGLERLARRIVPQVTWDDLVLNDAAMRALRDLTARARHRHLVLTQWRMRRGGGRGVGICALFGGDSGTGKTMAAEVIAADLGLDLYTVNLATVVDKYVGETEKNLERIFTEALGVNAVLFFDEADAIFGKRSEVRDAQARYANIESAYLLQRLESFDGLAVLATNLRANIDEAFTRRFDAIVDFPTPDAQHRLALWRVCLREPLPCGPDLDLEFLATAFDLSGGSIRAAATTAAYLAAADGTDVSMEHLVTAVAGEYRKLGRLVLETDFGDHLPTLGRA